jgi:ribosomal protein S18 acetylase RimI-like enzyme
MVSANLRFREATRADAAAMAQFSQMTFRETFPDMYSEEDLTAHLQSKCSETFFCDALAAGDTILLAHDGNELVGLCKIGDVGVPIAHPPADAQEIHRLYVHRKYQGGGLGRELMKRALDTHRLREASLVYLSVWEDNHRAKSFYFKNDFMPVGRYLYPVGKHLDNEMILARMQAAV